VTPRQRRVRLAWQVIGYAGLAIIGVLMLASVRWGIDPTRWAPFAFGGAAIGQGAVLAFFPHEVEAIWEERMRFYGYRGGFPVRGAGLGFIVVGGSMILQRLMS
jgi:hypothetical protein